jgi:hypothetical protein
MRTRLVGLASSLCLTAACSGAPTGDTSSERVKAHALSLVSRDARNVAYTPSRSGGLRATVGEGFSNVVVAHRNPDGSFTQTCVDSPDAVVSALNGTQTRSVSR